MLLVQPGIECHDPVISIEELSFSYNYNQVISNLNFNVLQRDFVGLVGSNGAGKTTLLRMIVGLMKPESGEIKLFGQAISKFKDWDRIGYVPQKNAFNPLFPATVREVVLSGLYGSKKMFHRISKNDTQKCSDALEVMRIAELADRRIGQLSGGQQQRTFLARALINNPDLLILDEPTVGIDSETQISFFHMIRHMHHHHNITFLMVSHDLDMLQSYLGTEAAAKSGKLKFYVKHTHDPEDCAEAGHSHALSDLKKRMATF